MVLSKGTFYSKTKILQQHFIEALSNVLPLLLTSLLASSVPSVSWDVDHFTARSLLVSPSPSFTSHILLKRLLPALSNWSIVPNFFSLDKFSKDPCCISTAVSPFACTPQTSAEIPHYSFPSTPSFETASKTRRPKFCSGAQASSTVPLHLLLLPISLQPSAASRPSVICKLLGARAASVSAAPRPCKGLLGALVTLIVDFALIKFYREKPYHQIPDQLYCLSPSDWGFRLLPF